MHEYTILRLRFLYYITCIQQSQNIFDDSTLLTRVGFCHKIAGMIQNYSNTFGIEERKNTNGTNQRISQMIRGIRNIREIRD